jgi:hypothetical protein
VIEVTHEINYWDEFLGTFSSYRSFGEQYVTCTIYGITERKDEKEIMAYIKDPIADFRFWKERDAQHWAISQRKVMIGSSYDMAFLRCMNDCKMLYADHFEAVQKTDIAIGEE